MPRVTITSSWPSASTAITEVCEKTLPMFRLVKKIGVVRPTTDDQQQQDQRRPGAQRRERGLQQAVAIEPHEPAAVLRRLLRLRGRHGHSPPTAPRRARPGRPVGELVLVERRGQHLDAVARSRRHDVAAVLDDRRIAEVLVQVVDPLDDPVLE